MSQSCTNLENRHNTDFTSANWAPKLVPLDFALLEKPTEVLHQLHHAGNSLVLEIPENLDAKNINTLCLLVVAKKKVSVSFSIGFTSEKYLALSETTKFEPFSEKQKKQLFGPDILDYKAHITELKLANN